MNENTAQFTKDFLDIYARVVALGAQWDALTHNEQVAIIDKVRDSDGDAMDKAAADLMDAWAARAQEHGASDPQALFNGQKD